jgi:hypothetical protein
MRFLGVLLMSGVRLGLVVALALSMLVLGVLLRRSRDATVKRTSVNVPLLAVSILAGILAIALVASVLA